MKTFDELKKFIEIKAAAFQAVDEGECYENVWECDVIQSQVANEVIIFAAADGLILKTVDLSLYIKNISKTVDDFDNETAWEEWSNEWFEQADDYEWQIEMEMLALADKQELPAQTQVIYEFWQSTFWPDSVLDKSNGI